MSIFDQPQEVINKYLEQTGQTEEEARAEFDEIRKIIDDDHEPLKGTDPSQEKKFTMPLGYEPE